MAEGDNYCQSMVCPDTVECKKCPFLPKGWIYCEKCGFPYASHVGSSCPMEEAKD